MKGKIKVIIITLIGLLAATGVILWKVNDISKKADQKQKEYIKQEKDLVEDQDQKAIDKVESVDIIPLHLTGEKKNVVTSNFTNVNQVYSTAQSAKIEEHLTDIKKNKIFTLDDPLWAYNPFGTNRNAMYVYFNTNGNCYCRYTISVKNDKIPDFTRTAVTGTAGNVTKEHEYQLVGLVAGETNYITMKCYNSDDELSESKTFSVTIPKSRVAAPNILSSQTGRSKTAISNGLYVVFQDGRKMSGTSFKKYAILLYDNSGVLRSEIPTSEYCGRNLESIYDTIMYAAGKENLVQVNHLGQVTKNYPLNGYEQSGEFTYDGAGNVYVIATAKGKKATPGSKVLEVELETGKVAQKVDMDTLFQPVYKNAVKKSKKKNVNWVELNGVQVVGTNQLLLSSKKLSSIIKISNVGSLLPNINYIIADQKIYKPYKSLRKKVLKKSNSGNVKEKTNPQPTVKSILRKKTKKDPFVSQYSQEAVTYEKRGSGKYDLTMLNPNIGNYASGTGEGYYYRFRVNEDSNRYQLKEKIPVDLTKKDGNMTTEKNGYIYCCSDTGVFAESDHKNVLIKQFHTGRRPYRVYKRDFKGFWFH